MSVAEIVGGGVGERKISTLMSICDDCWERRGWIVENMSGIVEWFGLKEFQSLQSVMAHHTGTAKRRIIKMMKELSSPREIEVHEEALEIGRVEINNDDVESMLSWKVD